MRKAISRGMRYVGQRLNRTTGMNERVSTLEERVRILSGHVLRERYGEQLAAPDAWQPLQYYEVGSYSMRGEDGLILHLLSQIGAPTRRFVEYGIEAGHECNMANLAINFGWSGLMVECDGAMAQQARNFYWSKLREKRDRVKIVQAFVTAENINEVLAKSGFEGEIDVLSQDIDGNDYWVLKALEVVQPRLIVAEYNVFFGPERNVTIPYDPNYNRWQAHESGFYFGASLGALTKLAESKGYVLVACVSSGGNAFFVRRDLAASAGIPACSAAEAYRDQARRLKEGRSHEDIWNMIGHLPLVEV